MLLWRTLPGGWHLLPTSGGLKSHTRWGQGFLLWNGLADLHHHSPAIIGYLLWAPLWVYPCSTVGRGAHPGLSKERNWIWISRENPQNPGSKIISYPVRLVAIHVTVQSCFLKPSLFQLMPVLNLTSGPMFVQNFAQQESCPRWPRGQLVRNNYHKSASLPY